MFFLIVKLGLILHLVLMYLLLAYCMLDLLINTDFEAPSYPPGNMEI